MADKTVVMASPTASIRTIKRDGVNMVQQRFLVVSGMGSVKEQRAYVWLDTDHEMLQEAESAMEVEARTAVERAYLEHRLSIRPDTRA